MFRALEIRDRASHLRMRSWAVRLDPAAAWRAQAVARSRAEFAMGTDLARRHLRIRVNLLTGCPEALPLAFAGAITRSRIWAEPSAAAPPRSSLYCTAGTSMWMSMRSRRGPEIFAHSAGSSAGTHHSLDLSLNSRKGRIHAAAA